MKLHGRRVVLCMAVLVMAISGAVGLAAEEEERPQFLVIVNEDVKPEAMETYMKARIADAQLWDQYGFEFPFMTFVQDFRVTTGYGFNAFAQFDGIPQKMEAWTKKTGGKSKQLDEQRMKCVSDSSSAIVVARPDLSYTPKNPAFTPNLDEPFYSFRVVYHMKPDKIEAAEALGRKVKALNEKKQSPMAYLMYQRIFGQDDYALIAVMNTKDKAAFVEMDKKMEENPDPEIEKLFTENAHLLKKIETQEGTFVPEASYIPEGTF